MNLLLDTHTLLWAVEDPDRLGGAARALISDPNQRRLISAATLWELSIKIGLGKLRISGSFVDWMTKALADLDASLLPIGLDHADAYRKLPFHHRDPFDRLLIAQAQCEAASILSIDAAFDRYGAQRVW